MIKNGLVKMCGGNAKLNNNFRNFVGNGAFLINGMLGHRGSWQVIALGARRISIFLTVIIRNEVEGEGCCDLGGWNAKFIIHK